MEGNMKKQSYFGLLTSAMLLTACAEPTHIQPTEVMADFEHNVGWLHGSCLAIKNDSIVNNTKLTLVPLDNSENVITARIARPAETGKDCLALLEDRATVNLTNGYSFYAINTDTDIDLAIGVIDMDVKLYGFDYCSTTEGLVFKLTNAGQSQALWRGYYYLGYDTETTCE
ncbi:hypothetical protein PE36_01842 [Moritella sp. PE36]|nr:hypothetical protein PE36_01842 [Moritella sp. PE36]